MAMSHDLVTCRFHSAVSLTNHSTFLVSSGEQYGTVWFDVIMMRLQINSEDSLCGSISSLGALGGAWIWIWEFVRRQRHLEIQHFVPLGIDVETYGFWTAWLAKGQKFSWTILKSGSSILTFWDLPSQICEILMRVAKWRYLEIWRSVIFPSQCVSNNLKNGTRICFQNL